MIMSTTLKALAGCICLFSAIAATRLPGEAQTAPPPMSDPANPSQANPVAAPAALQPASAFSLDNRISRLEERLNLALALKDERIQSINERADDIYKLLQLVGVIAAAALVFFSIRDIVLRWKEGQRQRGIDDIVKDMLSLQKTAGQQQLSFGELHLADAKTNARQQVESVQNVNEVIEVVKQTLAFRLEQEENFAQTIGEIKLMKQEQERARKQKLMHAIAIVDHFKKMSRMQFTSLTDEQHKRGIRLQGLVNELEEFLTDQEFEILGVLLYTCGVIAFYDNDVIEAKSYLDRAALSRAGDHNGELKTNPNYKNRFAFIHYYRALIQKNWGDLSEAQHEIEQSAKLLEDQTGEFLTPVTKAEILSYIPGDEERCQADLQTLLHRIEELEAAAKSKGQGLDMNQIKLRNRMLVLCGNTYFVRDNKSRDALARYTEAVAFNSNDYYALAAAARCQQAQGDQAAAAIHFRQCLDAIERSGDARRKRERSTRAGIAITGANAAKGCGDDVRYEQYAREARELLSGNLAVDGMSPKFFSPSTKRLVGATELLAELNT